MPGSASAGWGSLHPGKKAEEVLKGKKITDEVLAEAAGRQRGNQPHIGIRRRRITSGAGGNFGETSGERSLERAAGLIMTHGRTL